MLLTNAITRLLALTALLSVLLAGIVQAAPEATPAGAFTGIKVAFQLDPRITRGMYMGERWVSPPTYTMVQEQKVTIGAKATGLYGKGSEMGISADWNPGNAAMVQVSPSKGEKVELTVLQEGQTDLTVTYAGASKKLSVKAVRQNGNLRVDISQ